MTKETITILTNKEVIAVDQDKLGIQGFKHSSDDSLEIWYKPLVDDSWAVCFLNRSKSKKTISYKWKSQIINDDFSKRSTNFKQATYYIRNLWTKEDLGSTNKTLKIEVPSHDVLLVKLVPVE